MTFVQQLKDLAEQWRAAGHVKPADDILEVLAQFTPAPAAPTCPVLKRVEGDFIRCGQTTDPGEKMCKQCVEAAHG